MMFHDSTNKMVLKKTSNKDKFKDLDDTSDFPGLVISAVSMTLTASVASFYIFTEFYVSMNTGTKMTYLSWSLNVEWIIKNTLIDFWHPFSWRLWRPSYETKIKFKR